MAGVIDADYTGEIRVILRNHSPKTFCVKPGDKIAQIIFENIRNEEPMQEVQELPRTQRGEQGFSSTNKLKNEVFSLEEDKEEREEIERELVRYEQWVEQVKPNLTDLSYQATYEELRFAIHILGIKATIYPTQGDWPFRHNVVATVPDVMKAATVGRPRT